MSVSGHYFLLLQLTPECHVTHYFLTVHDIQYQQLFLTYQSLFMRKHWDIRYYCAYYDHFVPRNICRAGMQLRSKMSKNKETNSKLNLNLEMLMS